MNACTPGVIYTFMQRHNLRGKARQAQIGMGSSLARAVGRSKPRVIVPGFSARICPPEDARKVHDADEPATQPPEWVHANAY